MTGSLPDSSNPAMSAAAVRTNLSGAAMQGSDAAQDGQVARASYYFNVSDRAHTLCRLVGKAVQQGLTVAIATDSEAASEVLDRLLWEVPHTGFVPHLPLEHPLAARTPVLIDHRSELLPARDVLFNWRNGLPMGMERHLRIVEVVASDDAEGRDAARGRARAYRAAGFEVEFNDMAKAHG